LFKFLTTILVKESLPYIIIATTIATDILSKGAPKYFYSKYSIPTMKRTPNQKGPPTENSVTKTK
jgi:hypothetical protein